MRYSTPIYKSDAQLTVSEHSPARDALLGYGDVALVMAEGLLGTPVSGLALTDVRPRHQREPYAQVLHHKPYVNCMQLILNNTFSLQFVFLWNSNLTNVATEYFWAHSQQGAVWKY